MNEDDRITLAFIYKRSGKTMLKPSEIYLPLSMDLKWLSLHEAQTLVEESLKNGLLREEKGLLVLTFDVDKVDIPLGFKPSKKRQVKNLSLTDRKEKGERQDPFSVIIKEIVTLSDKDEDTVKQEVKNIAEGKNIIPEVAVLLLAQRYNIDTTKYHDMVERVLSG
ncbi:MAG: DUF2240 family protein [Candidatus Thermoplasmatota archaeon]